MAKELELKKEEEIKRFNPNIDETCSMSIEQSPEGFSFIQKLNRPSESIALDLQQSLK